MKQPRQSRAAGFTLIEMVLSVTILAVLAKVTISASQTSSKMTELGNLEAQMFRHGERAMKSIMSDLRMSGTETLNGNSYPHVFVNGNAGPGFTFFDHTPGPTEAAPGEADFGPVKSIVLCLPSDFDGDGRPELDADGNGIPELDGNGDGVPTDDPADVLAWDPTNATIHPDTGVVWSHADIGYMVTATGPNGENELVRVRNDGSGERKVLARNVERIEFDTPLSSGFSVPSIPSGAVRVRLFFRVRDDAGHVYRSRNEAIVRLRNG